MAKLLLLICAVAVGYYVPGTNGCTSNAECYGQCNHDDHAVCDLLTKQCHCHVYGEIPCETDTFCAKVCGKNSGCCNNDHHCHCDEPCDDHHVHKRHSHHQHEHHHPCKVDSDCHSECHDVNDAVCDVPSGECHCHDYGTILCSTKEFCQQECGNANAYCHNDHHCHC